MLKDLIFWIENRPRFKDKENLNKMIDAAKALGNPHHNFKSIHITGTNGKGSTAHFIHSILAKHTNVGLFTSPYIVKFNERIQINDEMINDNELERYLLKMKSFIEQYEVDSDPFTFFEIMTLMAFLYFSDKKVEYAIIEVGIGGTLDSTNIITPVLSIITSVGFDHQKQLGNTLESILDNKLGIVKEGIPLITAVKGFDEVIIARGKQMHAPIFFLDQSKVKIITNFPLKFTFEHHTYTPKLQGIYQVSNACLAIMAVNYLEPKLPMKRIKQGILEAFNPGRFEMISKEPYIILDGAHNTHAMGMLTHTIKTIFKDKQIKVLFACMQDKPFDEMLSLLKTISNGITLTTINYHRALDIEGLNYKRIKDPVLAFQTLKNSLTKEDVLLVTGSLYFVSHIRNNM